MVEEAEEEEAAKVWMAEPCEGSGEGGRMGEGTEEIEEEEKVGETLRNSGSGTCDGRACWTTEMRGLDLTSSRI